MKHPFTSDEIELLMKGLEASEASVRLMASMAQLAGAVVCNSDEERAVVSKRIKQIEQEQLEKRADDMLKIAILKGKLAQMKLDRNNEPFDEITEMP